VSVIIACRNEAEHITKSLDSALHQEEPEGGYEVIVADGMSDDGTRKVLKRMEAGSWEMGVGNPTSVRRPASFDSQREIARSSVRGPALRVIDNPGKIASTGLNAAIRVAKGSVILRMDAHTEYAPDYVRRCVEVLESTGADNVGGPSRTKPRTYLERVIAAAYRSPFSVGPARFHDADYEGYLDTVTYGCWRKDAFDRFGYFDEELVRNQDDELNLRLLRAGGRIWQNPAIRCWYSPRATLGGLFRQYMQYGFWKVPVIRKHRLPGSWRHLVPVAFVTGNVALVAAMAIAAASGAREWFEGVAAVWLALAAAYAAAIAAASVAAARGRGWRILPYLPAAFAAFHVSYGLGFAAGLLRFAARPGQPLVAESAFTRITR